MDVWLMKSADILISASGQPLLSLLSAVQLHRCNLRWKGTMVVSYLGYDNFSCLYFI